MTGKVLPIILELLQKDCDVLYWDSTSPIPLDVLYQWVHDADGMISVGGVRVDDDFLQHAKQVRVIAQVSVGYDNVDIDACTRRGIPVGNTPFVLVEATADLAFGLLLSVARRIHEGFQQVRSGEWNNNFEIPFGNDLFGKVLGIVGMGSIGAAVAKRAQASGMQVIYHNRKQREDDATLRTRYVTFDDLLSSSDFIVVLAPLTSETKGMFGASEFSKMKRSVYFINVARGGLVQTHALYDALKNRQIAYAALDVTDPEPLPANHPLLELPNILITPHIGSATHETRDRMARLAVENLLSGLASKPLKTCVNESVNFKDTRR